MTDAYREEKRQERRRRRLLYAERLRLFSEAEVSGSERQMIGMRSWYTRLRKCLTFGPTVLAHYFRDGEPEPCLMRGSIYALRMWGEESNMRRSAWAEDVLERQVARWLRKSRITCLGNEEWRGIVYERFWQAKIKRLTDRYGAGRWSGFEYIYSRVNERWNMSGDGSIHGGYVLVNGERLLVDNERLQVLREMHQLERKLRK